MEQIRLSTPKQILDAVPRLLGYSPVGSLVAIPLSGKHGGVILRFDVPTSQAQSPDRDASYANAIVGHLAHLNGIERVVFVLSPDLPFGSGPRPPFSSLAEAIVEASERAGIEVVLCVCRANDAWGVYGCDDPDCCDIGPRALGTQASWLEAMPRPGDHAQVLPASEVRRLAFAEADERHWQHHEGEDDFVTMRQSWLTAVAPASISAGPNDDQLAGLLCMLRGRHTAELLLVTVAFGADDALLTLSQVWGSTMSTDAEALELPEFSRKRVRRSVEILRHLATLVDLDDEPGLLASISWLEWASGRSSAAAAFARRALGVRPDNAVASSVSWLVERNVVPPWLAVVDEWRQDTEAASTRWCEG